MNAHALYFLVMQRLTSRDSRVADWVLVLGDKVARIESASSAFARAIKWGLLTVNPVTNSEPPSPAKRKRIALTTAQQDLLIASATGPWCIQTYLKVEAALGARRGEVLALRWQDVEDGRVTIARSLSQTGTVWSSRARKKKTFW